MGCLVGNTIREAGDLSVNINSELMDMLGREFINTGNPTRCCIKLYIQRFNEFDYVHPDTQVAKICTKILNIVLKETGNSNYINMFNKRIRSTISRVCSYYMKPYFSGVYIQSVDSVIFDSLHYINDIIKRNINAINEELESCKLVSVDVCNENNILPSDSNLYVCKLNKELTPDLVERYEDWYNSERNSLKILIPDNRASIKLILKEDIIDKKDLDMMISDAGKCWVIIITSKLSINPYLVIKKLYPKITIYNLYNSMSAMVYGTFVKSSDVCKCGNNTIFDKVRNKDLGICSKCLSKILIKSVVNKL